MPVGRIYDEGGLEYKAGALVRLVYYTSLSETRLEYWRIERVGTLYISLVRSGGCVGEKLRLDKYAEYTERVRRDGVRIGWYKLRICPGW